MNSILAKVRILGQCQRCEQGFSLVEVMIAASILASLSYFGMQLMEGQIKSQKGLEKRFDALNITSEIQSVLSVGRNCRANFKEINLKDYLFNKGPLPLQNFVKLRRNNPNDKNSETTILKIYSVAQEPYPDKSFHLRAPNISMRDYEEYDQSDDIYSVDTYLFLPFQWDGQQTTRHIPISFKLDEDGVVIDCTAVADREDGNTLILDPTKETQYNGMTGNEACEKMGKTCIHVISQNYATTVYGQVGLDNLCDTNYNQTLTGVQEGANLGHWHECGAKLGIYETYKIDKKKLQLTCNGIFVAMCQ